jgi:hypothetical protein
MAHDANKEILDKSSIDLNTSPALPTCPPTVGLDVDSLSPATKAALTTGYQTDAGGHDQYKGDGVPLTLEWAVKGGSDPLDTVAGDPTNGFMGRTTLLTER